MRGRSLLAMLRRTMLCVTVAVSIAALAGGCAAGVTSGAEKSAAPNERGDHDAEWYTIGAGRADFQKNEHDFELAATDCSIACKALASLERAADHLCVVAQPEECTDARARVDRARRAVHSQCGSC